MVWKKIPETKISKKDTQQTALYGLYLIVGLGVLAWAVEHLQFIG